MKKSDTNVNINFRILSFGTAQIKISGEEKIPDEGIKQPIIYGEPTTTNYTSLEIRFDKKEYQTPKITSGIY